MKDVLELLIFSLLAVHGIVRYYSTDSKYALNQNVIAMK
jgi:hypothetical protein